MYRSAAVHCAANLFFFCCKSSSRSFKSSCVKHLEKHSHVRKADPAALPWGVLSLNHASPTSFPDCRHALVALVHNVKFLLRLHTCPPPPPAFWTLDANFETVEMRATSTILSSCQASLAACDSLGLHLATGQHSTITLWRWDIVAKAWLRDVDIGTDSIVTQVEPRSWRSFRAFQMHDRCHLMCNRPCICAAALGAAPAWKLARLRAQYPESFAFTKRRVRALTAPGRRPRSSLAATVPQSRSWSTLHWSRGSAWLLRAAVA